MGRFVKRLLRFTAFASLVAIVFLTNIVHKLGFTSEPSKDDSNKQDDLFASFSSIPSAYADSPANPGDSGWVSCVDSGCPNSDAGPCGDPGPH